MKKLFKLFLSCAVLAVAAGLAACTDSLIEHEHNWEWTHDENYHWRQCDGCDQISGYGGHDFVNGVCPTCSYADPTYVPHEHTYGDWQIFAPSETEAGIAIRECQTCNSGDDGHVDEVILPVLGDPRYKKTVEGEVCVGDGRITYSITLNGEVFTFSIVNLKGHKLTLKTARPVTCTRDGNIECFVCEVCGKHFRDINGEFEIEGDDWIIPSQGHAFEKFERVYPTCTEGGNEEYFVCGVCNEKFINVNGKLCAAEDEDIYLPAAGHALQSHPGIEADCESPGVRAYWECMVCRKYFSDGDGSTEIAESDLIIPATGHDFGDWYDDMYFGHYRYSFCKHHITEEEPHEYENGVCKLCGYEQPMFYYDEDAPDGQSGYIVIHKPHGGSRYKFADIYLPYLLGQTDPELAETVYYPESFIEVAYNEQYGTRYLVELYEGGIHYTMQLYCNFEEGSTFKISSFAQRYEFFQKVDENTGYSFYLSQNIHQTIFSDVNDITAASLYKTDANGWNRQYLTPSHLEFSREESCLYWYCAPDEGETDEIIYRIDVTFDEDGKLSTATISVNYVHTYGDWEITADHHARYPTCEHYTAIEIGDHEYEDGACRVCGFKQPKVFTDEDGTGATIYTFEIDGEEIVRFSLDHIKDESGLMFGNDKLAEDVIKIGEDPVYGELYETTLLRMSASYRLERLFRVRFYWNISGGTFRLYSVDRYIELFSYSELLYSFSDDFGKNFGVAVYQTYYKTSFSPEKFTLLDCRLYVEEVGGSGQYKYLTPTRVEYLQDGSGFIWTVAEQVDGQTVETSYHVAVNPWTNGFAGTAKVYKA